MDTNQIASKDDINRLEKALEELKQQVKNLQVRTQLPSGYLSGKQVMELLNVKEWALRRMRIDGSIKVIPFGRLKRYPIEQFSISHKIK